MVEYHLWRKWLLTTPVSGYSVASDDLWNIVYFSTVKYKKLTLFLLYLYVWHSLYSAASTGMSSFFLCLRRRRCNFWVTTMRVCYRVSCDPVLTKLLVKLSVCWPRRARGEWSKQFRRVRGRGWGHGLGAYPSLISLLSDLYLINTPPSEKHSNTFSVQNAPAWARSAGVHFTLK